jgi:hypothetical protein
MPRAPEATMPAIGKKVYPPRLIKSLVATVSIADGVRRCAPETFAPLPVDLELGLSSAAAYLTITLPCIDAIDAWMAHS